MEIIIRGRGGQGAVTFAQLLAISAFEEGMQSQAFPFFGIERRGAPSAAYVRIAKEAIHNRSHIYAADIEVILDSNLLAILDVKKEIKKKGIIIVNSKKTIEELKRKYSLYNYTVYSIDATEIALEVLKKNVVNTAMLAFLAKVTGIVSLNSLDKALDEKFSKKEMAILNKKMVREVYARVK